MDLQKGEWDTPLNRASAQKIWAASPNGTHLDGVTTLKFGADTSPEDTLLLLFQNFVDHGLAAFVEADDLVDWFETGHGNVHHIVSGFHHYACR